MSAPLSDGRTWRAACKDHQGVDNHKLTAYAVGLRLDGVNAATLRSQILSSSFTGPPIPNGTSAPNLGLVTGTMTIGGGAATVTSGPGQLLTASFASSGTWNAASKDHLVASPGYVTAYTQTLNTHGIVEGFGAIEVQQVTGSTNVVGTGVGTSTGSVSAGWALGSLGAQATTTSGPGRMLFRIGTNRAVQGSSGGERGRNDRVLDSGSQDTRELEHSSQRRRQIFERGRALEALPVAEKARRTIDAAPHTAVEVATNALEKAVLAERSLERRRVELQTFGNRREGTNAERRGPVTA
jgi:hypothetical protein